MGYREYSRHRGCTLSTVQRAIKDGRISDALMNIEGKKMISVELADKLWKQNTDPRRANNHKGEKSADEIYTGEPSSKSDNDLNLEENKNKNPVDYQQARAKRELFTAQMAQINLKKEMKKLVETKKVRDYMFKIHTRARDSLLNIPDKLAPKLAAENDIHKIAEILNEEIQLVCDHFSSGEIDF